MSQQSEYKKRIGVIKRWLVEAGWTPKAQFEITPMVDRARAKWYVGQRRERAERLVYKAVRLLRGEAINLKGGKPPTRFMARVGEQWLLEHRGNGDQKMATVLSASADAVELQTSDGVIVISRPLE